MINEKSIHQFFEIKKLYVNVSSPVCQWDETDFLHFYVEYIAMVNENFNWSLRLYSSGIREKSKTGRISHTVVGKQSSLCRPMLVGCNTYNVPNYLVFIYSCLMLRTCDVKLQSVYKDIFWFIDQIYFYVHRGTLKS